MTQRWFDSHGTISIGAQCNGPEDGGLGDLKISLVQELASALKSTHCSSIDHYALVLRIGGEFGDFAQEQTHKIRRQRKLRLIGCDIDVPIAMWRLRSKDQLKRYLADRVFDAISLMSKRLTQDGEVVDIEALERDVSLAISRFLRTLEENSVGANAV